MRLRNLLGAKKATPRICRSVRKYGVFAPNGWLQETKVK